MRQPDINRVKKAKEHLKAATTILCNIKWENTSPNEDHFLQESKQHMKSADLYLDDIINTQ